ncbi:MAG TPA: aldehyde dehydrogenase [Candidatus Limnocylindrales bacterium]
MVIAAIPTFRTDAFIDGAFQPALSGERFATENPATGQILADVAAGDAPDVDLAVTAARRAFEDGRWSRRSPADRKAVLLRLADLLEANAEELAMLDSLEGGKPITDCREVDIPETIKTFRWYAEAADKLYDSIAPTGPEALGMIIREPIGVVAAVLPWNFPIMIAAWKAAPALTAGNSVVLKPAELTSLSTLRLAELAAEAGLPDGVLNVVPGLGETAGQALGRHMSVDVVSFTGSTEVGRLFLRYSSESNLKEVVLECGGKSPQVVMADARDLDSVADNVVMAGFTNMGENCTCGSRLIVHRSVRDELLERIVARTADWTVGDPQDPSTRIGPMIEAPHLDKVLGYIEAGRAEGARVVVGGGRAMPDSGGHFVQATVFDGVDNSMRIAREEIFGPVISTIAFDSEEEGLAIANDTNYGLHAAVYTNDLDTAIRAARSLRAGTVSVNAYSEGDITTPFGGYKESGFGGRDKGLEAFDQYTEKKTVWISVKG